MLEHVWQGNFTKDAETAFLSAAADVTKGMKCVSDALTGTGAWSSSSLLAGTCKANDFKVQPLGTVGIYMMTWLNLGNMVNGAQARLGCTSSDKKEERKAIIEASKWGRKIAHSAGHSVMKDIHDCVQKKRAGVDKVCMDYFKHNGNGDVSGHDFATGMKSKLQAAYPESDFSVFAWTLTNKSADASHRSIFGCHRSAVHHFQKEGLNWAAFWNHKGCEFQTNATIGSGMLKELTNDNNACGSLFKTLLSDEKSNKDSVQIGCVTNDGSAINFATTLASPSDYFFQTGKLSVFATDWANQDKCRGRVQKHHHKDKNDSDHSDSDHDHANSSSSSSSCDDGHSSDE